jgi:hypothetical protein
MSSIPNRRFSLDCHDAEFASRTRPDEWRRILVMRQCPAFLRALEAYGLLMPAYFADNIVLNRVVTEAWRFEMLVYLLYLHDGWTASDPRSGLTVANLQRICAEQKCASRGRVQAILGLMRVARYLRRAAPEADRRIVRLAPSEGFVGIVEGWNNRILQIIDAAMPEAMLAESHRRHERFGWRMRWHGAQTLLGGWKLLEPFPEVEHFVSRDGGWMLLLSCVCESLRLGEGREIAPVAVNLHEFGARFGVSRSHLRRLLESAHGTGLLEAAPQNGARILLSSRLVASFLGCMASELGHYRLWALQTQQELGLDPSAFRQVQVAEAG